MTGSSLLGAGGQTNLDPGPDLVTVSEKVFFSKKDDWLTIFDPPVGADTWLGAVGE
jgi:hypothetical protein